jgi:hypothetical protein
MMHTVYLAYIQRRVAARRAAAEVAAAEALLHVRDGPGAEEDVPEAEGAEQQQEEAGPQGLPTMEEMEGDILAQVCVMVTVPVAAASNLMVALT